MTIEDQREFLLRSLDDLERERAEGGLADDDYRRLRDDYTARAAAALRAEGEDDTPQVAGGEGGRPRSVGRALAVGGAVVAFAVVAALLLTRSLGERLPGESVTGNDQLGSEYDDLMAQADRLISQGEGADALEAYDRAARIDPGAAAPRARGALIVFQAGLVDQAVARLDEAESADPEYAETWFVRGIVLLQGRGDTEGARAAFSRCVELDPEGPYAEDARVAIQEIDAGPASPSPEDPTEDPNAVPNEQETP